MDNNVAECSRGLEQNISTCGGCESGNTHTAQNERTNHTNTKPVNSRNNIISYSSQKSPSQSTTLFCYSFENNSSGSPENSLPLIIHTIPDSPRTQPIILLRQPHIFSNLPSPSSFVKNQPQSLFLQAFAKLNQSSLNAAVASHFLNTQQGSNLAVHTSCVQRKEVSPPDSSANAPPSYSFVLRQMAARRRPRIFGTFIPSASFIPHSPPPNYMAAFDIYMDSPLPPLPPRVNHFGFTSMPVVCPNCGYAGMSVVMSKITLSTHLCAFCLCVLFCWVCAPLPYILRSCKDVYHYCRNCRRFLGMYCPTNPENSLS